MIPQIEPWIGDEELREIVDTVKSTWITEGKKTELFEDRIKKLCGTRYSIAVFNCTVGLSVALMALGVKPGDEVILPDFTFIATANSVRMVGAEPVLVDIDEKTFNIAPNLVEDAITNKTKAIIPVHIYGQATDMDHLREIANENGLFVIEDAAQGIGVRYKGKHVGGLGDIGCFSFYGNKTITTGEGGMITTNTKELAETCFKLKNHGREVKGIFIHRYLGYNFSFTDLQAAVGLAQLSKLDEILKRKRRNEKLYMEFLEGVEGVEFPYRGTGKEAVPWFTNILVESPQKLGDFLSRFEIETRRFFYPIHMQPCYNVKGDFSNSKKVYESGLSLPSSVLLTEDQIRFVCEKISFFMESEK